MNIEQKDIFTNIIQGTWIFYFQSFKLDNISVTEFAYVDLIFPIRIELIIIVVVGFDLKVVWLKIVELDRLKW